MHQALTTPLLAQEVKKRRQRRRRNLIFGCAGAGGGVKVGFGLGIMLAVLYIGASLITFAVQPLPARLIFFWGVGGLIESAIADSIIGTIYKPLTPRL